MSQHRDCLVLSVAWRLLTELFRRHGASHELRLLRCHPGISMAGQLMLLVDPEPQTILHCTRLILNLGGAVGTYEVCVRGAQTADGNFLAPALAGDLAAILDRVEAAMGFTAPTRLPPSTASMLTMRLVSEVLAASWLERRECRIETAWFDWSSGSLIQPWANSIGVDVKGLQAKLDTGKVDWGSVYLQVAPFFRLVVAHEDESRPKALIFDMDAAVVHRSSGDCTVKSVDIRQSYLEHGRRLEPLAAQLLIHLRRP